MKNKNIALLIDCENTSREAVEPVLNELAKYGVVNIRRAYGDWKSAHLKNWESHSLLFALKPIQQFGYTKGKNATDAAIMPDKVRVQFTVPTTKPVSYPVATINSSTQQVEAKRFVRYVQSPAGQAVLQRYGFSKP